MKKRLGTRIAEERKKKGLSQKEFAKQVNCTRQMVSRWELNAAKPRTDNIEKICEVLDISIEDLIGNKKTKKTKDSSNAKSTKVRTINYAKIITIIAIIAVLLFVLYVGYADYKYALLNDINAKMAEYMSAENYYFRRESFKDIEIQSSTEIWHKDGLYKIVETSYINDIGDSTTRYLDLNNKLQYMINEKEKSYMQMMLLYTENYDNGKYMYSFFPNIIQEETKEDYKQPAEEVHCKIENDKLVLKTKDEIVYLNKDTYLPITDIISLKENKNIYKYNIELSNVKDEDVNIPSYYSKVE